MVDRILTAARIPYRRTRYPRPPTETYAVYLDSQTTDGDDLGAGTRVITHSISVEVYEPQPDDAAEAAIEAAIEAEGLQWTKEDRYWLQTEQRYQVVYEFEYKEKRRAINA